MSRSFCPVQEESALIIVDYQDAILQTFAPAAAQTDDSDNSHGATAKVTDHRL